MAMGFPEIRCRNAILKTGNNGAEVAMNWLFEHMDDPGTTRYLFRQICSILKDIDNPPTTSATQGSAVYSPADLSQLMDMGFTQQQAKKALNETV